MQHTTFKNMTQQGSFAGIEQAYGILIKTRLATTPQQREAGNERLHLPAWISSFLYVQAQNSTLSRHMLSTAL
jgi:hypothetical protein